MRTPAEPRLRQDRAERNQPGGCPRSRWRREAHGYLGKLADAVVLERVIDGGVGVGGPDNETQLVWRSQNA